MNIILLIIAIIGAFVLSDKLAHTVYLQNLTKPIGLKFFELINWRKAANIKNEIIALNKTFGILAAIFFVIAFIIPHSMSEIKVVLVYFSISFLWFWMSLNIQSTWQLFAANGLVWIILGFAVPWILKFMDYQAGNDYLYNNFSNAFPFKSTSPINISLMISAAMATLTLIGLAFLWTPFICIYVILNTSRWMAHKCSIHGRSLIYDFFVLYEVFFIAYKVLK